MMLSARRGAGPLLAAALLALDAGGAWAQAPIVRLPERDRPLAGSAPQVFAVGKADGAAHEMFGEVSGVVFDAQDNLYVLDRQAKRVMAYDRSGRFLRQIAREGQGPGELIQPMHLMMGADGTLIVSDVSRSGFSIFRTDGTFVRNEIREGYIPVGRFGTAWHPGGGVVSTYLRLPGQGGGPPPASSRDQLLLVPFGSGQPRQIFAIPSLDRVSESTGDGGERRVMRAGPPAFSPPTLFGILPNGNVALSFTSGYTVRIVDLDGRTLRYLQRPVRTRLTTERDREQARQAQREQISSGRGQIRITMGAGGGPAPRTAPPSSAELERRMGQLQFADTIPALQGLRVSPSGRLLVERMGQNVGDPGPVDVVTPEGEYLGTFTGVGLPSAISRSGLAAYVEDDEDGVQRIVVRQLPPGWR